MRVARCSNPAQLIEDRGIVAAGEKTFLLAFQHSSRVHVKLIKRKKTQKNTKSFTKQYIKVAVKMFSFTIYDDWWVVGVQGSPQCILLSRIYREHKSTSTGEMFILISFNRVGNCKTNFPHRLLVERDRKINLIAFFFEVERKVFHYSFCRLSESHLFSFAVHRIECVKFLMLLTCCFYF